MKTEGRVTMDLRRAWALIDKGILSINDFEGLAPKYFKRINNQRFKCIRCDHPETSFMGIMQHIKKHKREDLELAKQKKLHLPLEDKK